MKKLRSRELDEGLEGSAHRAILYADGLTPPDFEKPLVALVNPLDEVVPSNVHLRELSEAAKRGIGEDGGIPPEFDTIAICDGVCQGRVGMREEMKRVRLPLLLLVSLLFLLSCASSEKKPALSDAQLLQQAEEALSDRKYEKAISLLKRLLSEYPASEWAPRAQLNLGKAYFEDEKYVEAKAEYQKFLDLHPKHQLADEAHFFLGLCYFAEIDTIDRDQSVTQRALAEFQSVIREAPDSRYAKEAKEKIRSCQEDLAGHEFFVGRFYFRKGKYQAAIGRFRYLLSHYPGTPVDEGTLYYLGESLYRVKEAAEAARVFVLLLERYPNSEYKPNVRLRLTDIEGF